MLNVFSCGKVEYAKYLRILEKLSSDVKSFPEKKYFLFMEHSPSVYTNGKLRKNMTHFLSDLQYKGKIPFFNGLEIFDTSRGGEVTWHGIGQVMGYPILDLRTMDCSKGSPKLFVDCLLDLMIKVMSEYSIEGLKNKTGVWESISKKKIGFVGLALPNMITNHGFSFNVSNDLKYFDNIIPCGIKEKGSISSLCEILGKQNDKTLDLHAEVIPLFVKNLEGIFRQKVKIATPYEVSSILEI